MARFTLTRSLGTGLAVVSLAFAACSKSSTSPGPIPTTTSTPTPIPTTSGGLPVGVNPACANGAGIAYEPDGGALGASTGVIQVTHFLDGSANLCAATPAPGALPPAVTFASGVGPLAISSDRLSALAVVANAAGGFTLAQDIFGASGGSIVPAGSFYDLGAAPPSPGPSGSPAPVFADVQSVAIINTTVAGTLAFAIGTPVTGSQYGIVALTSLNNAPPQFGNFVPFGDTSTSVLKSVPQVPRSILRVGLDQSKIVALVRGPADLLAFAVTVVGTGYQFNANAIDSTLGSNATLRGNGAIAFDPADAGRALVGGTTTGAGSTLTLVTGLPSAIIKTSSLTLPGNVRSIAIANLGTIAVVGTDAGIVVVSGVDTGTLKVVAPFAPLNGSTMASAPTYGTCAGAAVASAQLSSIDSVAFSTDQRFLVSLGTTPGVTCASGFNASIVAVAFSATTGGTPSPGPTTSASPPPTSFVQNNVIAPPAGADYLVVK